MDLHSFLPYRYTDAHSIKIKISSGKRPFVLLCSRNIPVEFYPFDTAFQVLMFYTCLIHWTSTDLGSGGFYNDVAKVLIINRVSGSIDAC